jgi:two-component system, OmpR family, sensor kinase
VDRRAAPDVQDDSLGPFIVAGVGLIMAIAFFTLGPLLVDGSRVVDASLLRLQLDAAAMAVAVLAGVLCVIRWRMTGDAPALWVGAALLFLGITTIGLDSLLARPRAGGVESEVLAWVHPATRITVLWLLYRALRSPQIDAAVRFLPTLFMAAGLTAALTVAFQLLPHLVVVFASAGDALVMQAEILPYGAVLLTAAWVVFGAIFGFRGLRSRRWLFAWIGLLFFALALAELLQLMELTDRSAWVAGPNALRLLGILCAVIGATRELIRAYEEQQVRLLETLKSEKTKEARLAAEHRALEELAHEARNALTAIEGATRTIEHYRDRLDEDTRASLSDAITREIARLQTLVSPERVRSSAGEFRLVDVVAAVVTAARSHDVSVHVDVPTHLKAYGQPAETGQVVQNLVENARRYAPGSPLHVRAEPATAGVILRIEDEGSGVPEDERAAIFERGRRGSAAACTDGSGLGLYVSARLMREQGGDIWVEDRPGGGASFALWLPESEDSARVFEEIGDQVEHALEGAQFMPLFQSGAAHDPNRRVAGTGDDHHDVGGDTGR